MSTPPFDPLASSASISTSERSIIGDTTFGVPLSNTTKWWGWTELNLAALSFGDEFQLKLYKKISGGSQIVAETIPLVGAQVGTLLIGPGFWYDDYDITLKKITGSDRTIRWVHHRLIGDSNVQQWVGSTVNALVAGDVPSNVKAFTAGAFTSAAWAANAISAAAIDTAAIDKFLDRPYEGAETTRHFQRLAASVLYRKASGLLTNFTSRDLADSKNRVVHTMGGGGDTRTPTIDGT